MNKILMEAKWKQIQGKSQSWWGKVVHSRHDQLKGKLTYWDGRLQESYVYERARISRGVDRRLLGYRARIKTRGHSLIRK